ncbi:UvrD-helicase domain-containing protein [Desulfothermus sp.]
MEFTKEKSIPSISIIKASAGSGKTFELAINFLKMLNLSFPNPFHLRKIIAITFTNKAAYEMKERILYFLKNIALSTDFGIELTRISGLKKQDAIKWLDIVIENYTDFNVKTIDSLLFSLFKGFCFELNMSPELDVVFSLDEIIDESFDLMLKNLIENNYDKFLELLTTYLNVEQKRGFYPENGIKRRFLELYKHAYKGIRPVELEIDKYYLLREKVRKTYDNFYKWCAKLNPHLNKSKLRSLRVDLAEEEIVDKAFWKYNFKDLFKKKELPKVDKEDLKKFKKVYEDFNKSVEEFSRLIGKFAYYQAVGYTYALNELTRYVDEVCRKNRVTLLSTWIEHIKEQIIKQGCLPLIYAYLGEKLLYFLFDEFQDTSREQWEGLLPLLEEAISRGGTVFVVGDVKQAIYRWRGGDWTLFNDIKNTFYINSIKESTLPYNYRSHPAIVDFVGKMFLPLADYDWVYDEFSLTVLGKNRDKSVRQQFAQSLSHNYKDVKQVPKVPAFEDSSIYLLRLKGEREDVQNGLKKHLTNSVKELWDRISTKNGFDTLAILVRSNEQAKEVSSWLLEKNIPVITENSLNLWASTLIRGIYCLLRLILDPLDTVAQYGVLVSGILPEKHINEHKLISTYFKEKYTKLIAAIDELLDEIKKYVTYVSCYELLMIISNLLNLEERFYSNELQDHRVFWEKLLELTYEVETEGRLCLEDYLDFLESGGLDSQIGLPEDSMAVQVMTIHKAKGLEFDYVYIPYTDWDLDQRGRIVVKDSELVSLCKKAELFLTDVKKMRDEDIAYNAMELINLFYVALTRAKKGIYLYLLDYKKTGPSLFSKWIEKLIQKANLNVTDIQ